MLCSRAFSMGAEIHVKPCAQVILTLLPHDQSSRKEVVLTRQKIATTPVSSQLCSSVSSSVGPASASGKLGYVRIATFNKQTTESAKAAFRQLKADGATRFVASVLGPVHNASLCMQLGSATEVWSTLPAGVGPSSRIESCFVLRTCMSLLFCSI